jgi:GGDEF domain-containing protein
MVASGVARRLIGAVLLLLAAWMAPAAAREVAGFDATRQPVPLADAGEFWIDPTGQAKAHDVATDRTLAWQPTLDGRIYPLTTGKALWIRFSLPPAAFDGERWYLEVPYSSVDKVTLFTADRFGLWVPQSAGDLLPVSAWPVPHRHPLLPLGVVPRGARDYMLRVENGHTFSAPLQFVTDSHIGRVEQRTSLIMGMYFGLVLLAMMLSVLGGLWLRDRTNVLYAMTAALMGLTQAALTGLAGLHLWPNAPRWNDVAPLVLPVLGVGAVQWFFAGVISLSERSWRFNASVHTVAALAIPVAFAIVLVDPAHRFKLMVPYIVVASYVGFAAVIWAARRGDRYAPWVLAGSLPVVIGAVFPLARTAGLIPVSFLTAHGMQIGIAFELPILLVMLLLRSQHRREHARRLLALGRIDPATGLLNADVFHERLVRLIARSQRLKYRSAMLIVEIVNLAQVRRTFEREATQALTLHVTGGLLSIARDIDSVGRLSDHRFGLLLEGPLRADEVAAAGPRIVARCLMPIKGKPIEWSAQVRVAQALIPMDGTDPDQLIGQLEMLLASAPADSKRAVLMLSRQPGIVPTAF